MMKKQNQAGSAGLPDEVKAYSPEQVMKMYPNLHIRHVGNAKENVVHMRCAGIDVHKKLLVAAACQRR